MSLAARRRSKGEKRGYGGESSAHRVVNEDAAFVRRSTFEQRASVSESARRRVAADSKKWLRAAPCS